MEISAESNTEDKEIIDEKIIKLETEVAIAVKIQKDIINSLALAGENVCETKNTPTTTSKKITKTATSLVVEKNADFQNKIKILELENEKQLSKINSLIKKDIKSILVKISEVEENN